MRADAGDLLVGVLDVSRNPRVPQGHLCSIAGRQLAACRSGICIANPGGVPLSRARHEVRHDGVVELLLLRLPVDLDLVWLPYGLVVRHVHLSGASQDAAEGVQLRHKPLHFGTRRVIEGRRPLQKLLSRAKSGRAVTVLLAPGSGSPQGLPGRSYRAPRVTDLGHRVEVAVRLQLQLEDFRVLKQAFIQQSEKVVEVVVTGGLLAWQRGTAGGQPSRTEARPGYWTLCRCCEGMRFINDDEVEARPDLGEAIERLVGGAEGLEEMTAWSSGSLPCEHVVCELD